MLKYVSDKAVIIDGCENLRCPWCGSDEAVEIQKLQVDKRFWDGVEHYITKCKKCDARTIEELTPEAAMQDWIDEKFTHETKVSNTKLTADKIHTDNAVALASAIMESAGDEYRILWCELVRAREKYLELEGQYPWCLEALNDFLEADRAMKKVWQHHPDYASAKERYDKASARHDECKRLYPEFFEARNEYMTLVYRTDCIEDFIKETRLLSISSVTPEEIITTLRHQGENMDSDVILTIRPGKKSKGEVKMMFLKGKCNGFYHAGERVVITASNDGKSLLIELARGKRQAVKINADKNGRYILSNKEEVVSWAERHSPYVFLRFDGFHKRFVITERGR